MNQDHHKNFLLFFVIITLILIIHMPASFCQDNETYIACGEPLECGDRRFMYPFWGGSRPERCGHPSFEINCESNVPFLTINSTTYKVVATNSPDRILTVAREDLLSSICPSNPQNAPLDFDHFSYARDAQNITLAYGCSSATAQLLALPGVFNCSSNLFGIYSTMQRGFDWSLVSCQNRIIATVNQMAAAALANPAVGSAEALTTAISSGFSVLWTANETRCTQCENSAGRCGSDSAAFACYCADGIHSLDCDDTDKRSKSKTSLGIGLGIGGAVLAGIGIGWLIFFCRQRRKRIAVHAPPAQIDSKDLPISSSNGPTSTSTTSTTSIPSYPSSKSETDLLRGSSYFGAQVFSFSELEEATDNFERELGDGGFGTVYYGKLHDGRVVAVKRLYENNFKRVEQFMNEIEILTKLRHQNLVTLYGCTSRRSRDLLLVYEYVPNGTVADHLHGKLAKSGSLSWPVRLNIAIETADALAYLHTSDIIHRDVKTNNILLDNDFHVKVADFGLSRLFPTDVTHVSTAPQGTPGYVDPEYYKCYQLTERSDVYSFGVVLIELISSLQAVDTNRHRHDINLANMAVNKIQNDTLAELVNPSFGFLTSSSVKRMATLVAGLAFRCLQEERDMRPSMQEVLETLREIQNGELNTHKGDVLLDIVLDEVGLLNGNITASSTDSTVTDEWINSSTPNSSV